MPRIAKKKSVSTSADLGTLQKELQRIADDERRIREEERQLAEDKARVEKQLAQALKELGILDMLTPRDVDAAKAPARKRRAAAGAGAGAGAKRKARAGGKRYSSEEKQAAVEYVQQRQRDSGVTLTQAIEDFNKEAKPRGKAALNYQNYKRWSES